MYFEDIKSADLVNRATWAVPVKKKTICYRNNSLSETTAIQSRCWCSVTRVSIIVTVTTSLNASPLYARAFQLFVFDNNRHKAWSTYTQVPTACLINTCSSRNCSCFCLRRQAKHVFLYNNANLLSVHNLLSIPVLPALQRKVPVRITWKCTMNSSRMRASNSLFARTRQSRRVRPVLTNLARSSNEQQWADKRTSVICDRCRRFVVDLWIHDASLMTKQLPAVDSYSWQLLTVILLPASAARITSLWLHVYASTVHAVVGNIAEVSLAHYSTPS